MATGTIAVQPDNTSVLSGQRVAFAITVTNTGSSQATIQSIMPSISPLNGWANFQEIRLPFPGVTLAANAASAPILAYGVFYQNQNQDLNAPFPQFLQFNVTFLVIFSDGTSISSSQLTISASPITTPPTAMPGAGQARHESNLESGLSLLFL